MEKTVKLNGEDVIIRASNRALVELEELTGKSIYEQEPTVTAKYQMIYCTTKACNREKFKNLTFDEFLDKIDSDLDFMEHATEALAEINKKKQEQQEAKTKAAS